MTGLGETVKDVQTIAALDLGSNSFLMTIADVDSEGTILKVHYDGIQMTRLSEKVGATGRIQPTALKRAEACFEAYAAEIKKHPVDRIVAVTTSAARDAENRQEFLDLAYRYQIQPEVIAGEREAELTFSGALQTEGEFSSPIGVIDIGGGSTEILLKDPSTYRKSFNIGSVRLTEAHVHAQPISEEDVQAMEQRVFESFKELPTNVELGDLVAVAGTPVTLACLQLDMAYDEETLRGYRLKTDDLKSLRDRLAKMTLDQRRDLIGMPAGREDVIVAGATILYAFCKSLNASNILVSTKGVRHGLLSDAGKNG